jgi:predicted transcriptional regulator
MKFVNLNHEICPFENSKKCKRIMKIMNFVNLNSQFFSNLHKQHVALHVKIWYFLHFLLYLTN